MAKSTKSSAIKPLLKQKRSTPPLTTPDGTKDSEPEYGVPVPDRLREAIATERDNLCKVESLLACLFVSLQQHDHPFEDGPYFPPVAQLARELVVRVIDALDPFVLRQRLLQKSDERPGAAEDPDNFA